MFAFRRLHNLFEMLRRNAAARIANRKPDVIAGQQGGNLILLHVPIFCNQRDGASVRHCVAGIDDQVYQDLFDLNLVGTDGAKIRRQSGYEPNLVADHPAKHMIEIAKDRVQAEYLWRLDILPAEGEQSFGECGGSLGCFADLGDVPA